MTTPPKKVPLKGEVLPPITLEEWAVSAKVPDALFLDIAWDGIGIAFVAIGLAILFRKAAA